tara:strand:+ start:592 stop:801 length:210 start_codon:yes stop_codon:yes gene_type:complete
MGDMKTKHTFKPMEFAQYFDNRDVHHAVTVLEVNHDAGTALIHYYTGIEFDDVRVRLVQIDSLIPIIGA